MDIPFILRNFTGRALARAIEQVPSSLRFLPNSRSTLKPFIATWLRSEPFSQVVDRDIAGFRMRLHLGDRLQRRIYLGVYENEEIEWCRPLVREGGTCIDLGANVGWFTLHFADWVGVSGRVIALEADLDVAATLRENGELSRLAHRIEVINSAVSDKIGILQFARSFGGSSGWGSAHQLPGNESSEIINVSSVTLDSIVAERAIADVDVLKVDVEAHEFAVLEGARDSLGRRIFRNILIEWAGNGHAQNGRSLEEMTSIFDAAGYLPSAQTVKLLHEFSVGAADPKQVCVNLLYHRPLS